MSRKNVILKKPLVIDGDMSGPIVSNIVDTIFLDNIDFFIVWTGTSPVGEMFIEVTNDDITNPNVVPVWTPLEFSLNLLVNTNTGDDLVTVRNIPGAYIRFRYAETSGVGTINVSVSARQF